MKKVAIESLYTDDYRIRVVNGLRQRWKPNGVFSCLNEPKRVNMLLYLDGLKAEYVKRDGTRLCAGAGELVYIPIGCEYAVRFYDMESGDSSTVGINFFLYDRAGAPFILSDDICIFKTNQTINYKLLISKIDVFSEAAVPCPGRMKAGMYDVLSALSEMHSNIEKMTRFESIAAGISYLENTARYELSVEEIAALCNVSAGYFRRLFREYAGVPPVEYILNKKMEKAKLYLEYESLTVAEISDLLSFTDSAYFSKQFKRRVGLTPTRYRRMARSGH